MLSSFLAASNPYKNSAGRDYVTISPIYLDTGTDVYVEGTSEVADLLSANFVFATDQRGITYQPSPTTYGGLVFTSLPKGATLRITFERGRYVKVLGSVTTTYTDGMAIPVSGHLHALLKQQTYRERVSARSIAISMINESISRVEQASFLQRYYLDGAPVKSLLDLEHKFRDYLFKLSEKTDRLGNCKCTNLVVLNEFELTPGDIQNALGTGEIIAEQIVHSIHDDPSSNPIITGYPILPETEYYVGGAGPAKLWFSYSDGWKRNKNDAFGGVISTLGASTATTSSTVNQTTLGIAQVQAVTLFCDGGARDLADECECEKDVTLNYFYESKVETRAQLLSSSGTKRALAIGEDVAMAFYIQEQEDIADGLEMTIVETVNNLNFSNCNANPNTDWIGNGVGVVLSAAAIVASFVIDDIDDSPGINAVRAQLTAQLLTQTTELVNNLNQPIPDQDNCGPSIQPFPTVIPMTTVEAIKLRPNRTVFFGINSGARMVNRGRRSWQSEVVIRSNHYLSMNFPSGRLSGNNEPDCCSPINQHYYWNKSISADFVNPDYQPTLSHDPNSSEDQLRQRVGATARLSGAPYPLVVSPISGDFVVGFDYGRLLVSTGSDRKFCELRTNLNAVDAFPLRDDEPDAQKSSSFNVANVGDSPITKLQNDITEVTATVVYFDVLGRVARTEVQNLPLHTIDNGAADLLFSELLVNMKSYQPVSLAPGIYFANLVINSESQTLRSVTKKILVR